MNTSEQENEATTGQVEPPAYERLRFYAFWGTPDERYRNWVAERVTTPAFVVTLFFQAVAIAAFVAVLSLILESEVNWLLFSVMGLAGGFLIRLALWARNRDREMKRYERTWAARRKLAETRAKKSKAP